MSQEFFEAIRAGNRERVSEMLAADSTLLAARDGQGVGPYAVAKYSGRNEVAALLLERGIELDVFTASMAGAEERVLSLIREQAARASEYSQDGWTPLHLACFFGHPAVAEALLAYGADVHAQSRNAMHNLPLHAAAAGRNRDVLRILLEHGADVNARQEGGWTALHSAAQSGDVELVRQLIASGADVQARASNQQNALDLALTKGHQAVVDVLDEYATDAPGAS